MRPTPKVLVAFAAIVVLFGVNFVAVRFSNRELDPLWGATFRFLLAAAGLAVVVVAARVPLPRGRALAGAMLFGALAFGLTFGLLYWGLVHVGAGVASVVFALIPLTTLLLASGIGQEKLRVRPVVGALVALAGIAIAFGEQLALDVPPLALVGVFVASIAAAASGVVVKGFPRSHPVATNAVAMAVGAAMLAVVAFATGETARLPTTATTWFAVLWLVVSSSVGFVLMVWVIGQWTASAAAYTSVLAPLVTIATATALAGEATTPLILAASAIVLLGAWLGMSKGKPTMASDASTPARP